MTEYGYAGQILNIDLSGGQISRFPTQPYVEDYLGGRGLAARLYWETAPLEADAYDPENCLMYATGPLTGFTGLASPRWQVAGKGPLMDPPVFSYANLGNRWGTRFKMSGYDGLVMRGRAERPAYIYIRDGAVEIRDASALWGKSTFEVGDALRGEMGSDISVLTIGPAAENMVVYATMITDDGASGAGGLGSVMGSKNLKAIVVAGENKLQTADPEGLDKLREHLRIIRRDTWKNWLNNIPGVTHLRACHGCGLGCFRKAYVQDGRRYKFFCQPPHVYWTAATARGEDYETILLCMRLCDHYGLDTTVMQPMVTWLGNCYREGLLDEKNTGLPLDKIGSMDFIEKLTGMIARREGFGDLLAGGIPAAASHLGQRAVELTHGLVGTRAGESLDYDPRLVIANALLYATEPRRPINQMHELTHALWLWMNWTRGEEPGFLTTKDFINVARNFWGGEIVADFTTPEGKALAARKIQDRTYAKESLILCDFLWPVVWVRFADDHTGDPSLESKVFSAITGRQIDEAGLNRIGERIFNLQRAIFLRQGWPGREGDKLLDYMHDEPLETTFFNADCVVPGKNGEITSRKGAKIDRKVFEDLKNEYYALRGWDIESGLPTEKGLKELGLADVAADLKSRGLTR